MLRSGCWILCLFFWVFSISAQQRVMMGKIEKRGSTDIIIGANIINLKQGRHNVSDMGGNYKIAANPGDTVIFSSAGFVPDTVVVAGYMLEEKYLVALWPNVTRLQTVVVDETHNYQMDSLQRREENRWILDRKHPVRLWNEKRSADQPGFNFSPIGYFSRGERQKRRLKKRLLEQEREYYIDSRFPVARVSQITGLTGDSLRTFMRRYRPSYEFCRRSNNQDIFLYINDRVREFRRGEGS